MKKALLKVFGVAALAAGMMYNVQMSDTLNSSDISLAALGNLAVAQSENPYNFRYESPGKVYSSSCGCYIWVTNCPTGPGYC